MHLTALDIGSSQIKALVSEIQRDNKLSLLGVFKTEAAGIRRGEVVAIEDAAGPLGRLLEDVKKINKAALKNIFVNVSGGNVKLQHSRGIVAVSRADSEIYQEDVDRVIKASQAINIGPNRMIIHTLTKEFIVDGISGILDPLGMIGNRLEVQSLIIDSFKSTVNNLMKCVESAGGHIAGLIYSPLAASRSVLTKNQKDLGAVAIDIGAQTTGISVFEENNLLQVATLGMGAGHITNDLAIGLRCPVKAAEAIKLSFGFALSREISNKEKVELDKIDKSLEAAVSRRFISEIIEVRLAEIFELINNELKLIGKVGKLPAGAVLTGGGAKIPGIVNLAKKELKLPVQIGIPDIPGIIITNSEFSAELEDPEFAVAAGLLIWGSGESLKNSGWLKTQGMGKLSKLLKYFLP